MKKKQTAYILPEELYQINFEIGSRPEVNLSAHADERDLKLFEEAVSFVEARDWIETPRISPDGLYTRRTIQGLSRIKNAALGHKLHI